MREELEKLIQGWAGGDDEGQFYALVEIAHSVDLLREGLGGNQVSAVPAPKFEVADADSSTVDPLVVWNEESKVLHLWGVRISTERLPDEHELLHLPSDKFGSVTVGELRALGYEMVKRESEKED